MPSSPKRVPTRKHAAAAALGSVRAEGLDPSRAEQALGQWTRGEIATDELDVLAKRAAAGESLEGPAAPRAA